MKKPNYAPVYASLYPELCKTFRKNGYALAIHGSMARDFDLIAVKWIDNATTKEKVIKEITDKFAISIVGKPEKRGVRNIYTLSFGFGECFIDLSFIN